MGCVCERLLVGFGRDLGFFLLWCFGFFFFQLKYTCNIR